MKNALSILFLFFVLFGGRSSYSGELVSAWRKIAPAPSVLGSFEFGVDNRSNSYVLFKDNLLRKFSPEGLPLWKRQLAETTFSLQVHEEGNAFAVSFDERSSEYFYNFFNREGEISKRVLINVCGTYSEYSQRGPNLSFYVVASNGFVRKNLCRFSESGRLLWKREFPHKLVVVQNEKTDNLFVFSSLPNGGTQLLRISGTDGKELVQQSFDKDLVLESTATMDDGDLVYVMQNRVDGSSHLNRASKDGTLKWQKRIDLGSRPVWNSLSSTSAGGILMTFSLENPAVCGVASYSAVGSLAKTFSGASHCIFEGQLNLLPKVQPLSTKLTGQVEQVVLLNRTGLFRYSLDGDLIDSGRIEFPKAQKTEVKALHLAPNGQVYVEGSLFVPSDGTYVCGKGGKLCDRRRGFVQAFTLNH